VWRQATERHPKDAAMFFNYADVLQANNQVDEAVTAIRQAVALRPDWADAQCKLGDCLLRQGRFAEGREVLQKGRDLGLKQPGWKYAAASAQWLRNADKLIETDDRLAAVLDGKVRPADAAEQLSLAHFCLTYKRRYGAAARFFAAAFAERPQLAEDRKAG